MSARKARIAGPARQPTAQHRALRRTVSEPLVVLPLNTSSKENRNPVNVQRVDVTVHARTPNIPPVKKNGKTLENFATKTKDGISTGLDKSQARYAATAANIAMLAFQSQAERLSMQICSLEEHNSALETQIRALDTRSSWLSVRNGELAARSGELAARNNDLEGRMRALEADREKLLVSQWYLQAENARIQTENARLQAENARLLGENGWARTLEAHHADRSRVLSAANYTLERDKGRLVDALVRIVRMHEARVPFARGQIDALRGAVASLTMVTSAPVTDEALKTILGVLCHVPQDVNKGPKNVGSRSRAAQRGRN